MNVLIGCEFSGTVRDAFRARGHNAYSCDLLPSFGSQQYHLQCDVFEAVEIGGWDLAIFHPPCTYLCRAGIHWNNRVPGRAEKTDAAVEFVRQLMTCGVPRWMVENPIGVLSSRIRKPDQIIHPWQHGHPETKKNLFMAAQPSQAHANPDCGRQRRQGPENVTVRRPLGQTESDI